MRHHRWHTPRRGRARHKKRWQLPRLLGLKSAVGQPDYVLLGVIGALVVLGLVMLSSASSVKGFQSENDVYFFLRRQVFRGLLPGALLFFFFAKVDYRVWKRYTIPFLVATIGALLLVFVPGLGQSYDRAQSWVGVGGLSFQPSELAKLGFILFLSGWFAERGRVMNRDFWNGLVPFAVILTVVAGLIVFQPDYGTLMVVGGIALGLYFLAGAKLVHLFGLVAVGIGTLGLLLSRSTHALQRLTTFLHPELDPQGIGYQINQGLLAIGSGGIFGLGFGQSRQKFAYLPEAIGDSIFAIIAEEMGFLLAVVVLILFLVILLRGYRIAHRAPDDYGHYLAFGIVLWVLIQAFFNIGAMLGLMPLTGIPLPLISYGGTAMAALLAGLGILTNISKHAVK